MSVKKIGVICAYQFPEGMAPTTRILAYCKGLKQNGVNCEVFSFIETNADSGVPLEGVVDDIKYHKSYIKHGNSLLNKFLDKCKMLNRLRTQIKESNEEEPFDFLFLAFDSLDKFYSIVPIVKSLHCKMLFIGDEFPEPIRRLKEDIPWWHNLAYRYIHHFLKGRILMTENLKTFYDERAGVLPTYIMNSIVDEKRFEGITRQDVSQKYLCYMGNMQLAKDNVDNIIRAFSKITDDFPDYQLWLYGTPSDVDRSIIEKIIYDCRVSQKVIIKGRVDFCEVPQILANASLLVTSQPITKRAQGGFPTKMAEYMLSGTPMIVTNVGEISKYVQDGITTFMVEPCDPFAYALKLKFILQNPNVSSDVANRAKKYALSNFCSKPVTQGLVDFMSNLC